jgi:hypothetical protein
MTTTYTPAADRYEAFAATTYEPARERFRAERRSILLQRTKAELLAQIGSAPALASLTKPELVDRVLNKLWSKSGEQATLEELRRPLVKERELLDRIADSVRDLEFAKETLATAVAEGKLYKVTDDAARVRENAVIVEIFERVAELTGPDEHEPLEALLQVIAEETVRVLEDLEANTHDLFPARVRARWIRRTTYLIEG